MDDDYDLVLSKDGRRLSEGRRITAPSPEIAKRMFRDEWPALAAIADIGRLFDPAGVEIMMLDRL